MKSLLLAAMLVLTAAPAFADSCTATSADKKLAGAAKTSFMKKCTTDAEKSCDDQAAAKKIFGAAKASFTKKCVTDAIGS
jgi:hypothetical protein